MLRKKLRVVIVGGGFGGVKAALELSRQPEVSIQLISDSTHFEYHGALYRSAVGHSPKEVVIPLKEIFENTKNVQVVLDKISYIDDKKKLVVGSGGEIYFYDKVIFSLGSTVNYFGIDGLKEHSETMHDISSTLRLRKKMVDVFSTPKHRPVRIAIVGGGASGVELATEVKTFAELIAKNHKLPKPNVRVILIEAGDRLLPNLSPKASKIIAKRLIKLGVEIYLNLAVESCEEGNLCLSAGNIGADILIWTAGVKPVEFYNANSQVFTLERNGRVAVDDFMHAQGHKDIYVIGDNAQTKYSGMAQTAIYDAKYVAKNIIAEINKNKVSRYRAQKPIFVITGGGKWAVVQINNRVISGARGWRIRRKADLAIFRNFEPYQQAIKIWRAGNKVKKF
jgi:NADH dehydrogenase